MVPSYPPTCESQRNFLRKGHESVSNRDGYLDSQYRHQSLSGSITSWSSVIYTKMFAKYQLQIATKSNKNDISITTRIPGTTIGAAPFFQRTAILHVMTNAIRVLEPGMFLYPLFLHFAYGSVLDGSERQIIKDMDGNMPRPKIRACSISDPFVLIIREDDSIGLFIGETERGKIRRKDMSPMGDKVCLFLFGESLPLTPFCSLTPFCY